MHLLAVQYCDKYVIISHIAELAAVKRVEKVLAAVQQFLECGTNRIGKVAETPSVFTMEK